MLHTSAWLSNHKTADGSNEYFFINTELSCMITASNHLLSSGRAVVATIPVWYTEITHDEVRSRICNRSKDMRSSRSIYRIYDDFFQWVNIRETAVYSFWYTKVSTCDTPSEVQEAYEKALNKNPHPHQTQLSALI